MITDVSSNVHRDFALIFELQRCSGGSRNSRRGDLVCAKNLKPHPLFTWPRPSLGRCEAFLCFCRGAATIFDR